MECRCLTHRNIICCIQWDLRSRYAAKAQRVPRHIHLQLDVKIFVVFSKVQLFSLKKNAPLAAANCSARRTRVLHTVIQSKTYQPTTLVGPVTTDILFARVLHLINAACVPDE